jgi:hypothetical protein
MQVDRLCIGRLSYYTTEILKTFPYEIQTMLDCILDFEQYPEELPIWVMQTEGIKNQAIEEWRRYGDTVNLCEPASDLKDKRLILSQNSSANKEPVDSELGEATDAKRMYYIFDSI